MQEVLSVRGLCSFTAPGNTLMESRSLESEHVKERERVRKGERERNGIREYILPYHRISTDSRRGMGWREASIKLKCVCASVASVCHHHYHLWLDSFMKYSIAKDRPEMEGATRVFEWHLIFCSVYIPEDNTEQVLALFHHKPMTRAIPSSFYYSDVMCYWG